MRVKRGVVLFAVTVAVCFVGLLLDNHLRRPTKVPAPSTADSLAGVIARVFPEYRVDSSSVGRVTWYVSPERFLGLSWISTTPYEYRGTITEQTAPMVGMADLNRWSVTLVREYANDPLTIKHELTHLLLHLDGHPPDAFRRIETYTGR